MEQDSKIIAEVYRALGNEKIFAILKFLYRNKTLKFTQIRNAIFSDSRIDNGSISYCLKKLVKTGLVNKVNTTHSLYDEYQITYRGKTIIESTNRLLETPVEELI